MESVVEGYREGKGAEKPTSEHTAAGGEFDCLSLRHRDARRIDASELGLLGNRGKGRPDGGRGEER
jgi:hypothetical protein